MLNTPSISVVMSVYNGARPLPETIDSVLAQTYGTFELIVVDDGSTEPEVAQMLADYASRDKRVKLLHKPNEGLTRALIDGCHAARGAYIARLDNGDIMTPERLEKQKVLLDAHPDAVLATCWTEFCGPAWEPMYTVRNKPPGEESVSEWVAPFQGGEEGLDRLLGPTHHGSVLFRREAYLAAGGYRPQFYCGQDWDLWYRLAEHGTFTGVQRVLYRCRIFPDGISMRNVERQRQLHACSRGAFTARARGEDETPFLQAAEWLRPSRTPERVVRPVSPSAAGYYFIGEALRRNGDRRCRKYFLKALRRQPTSVRSWARLMQTVLIKERPVERENGEDE